MNNPLNKIENHIPLFHSEQILKKYSLLQKINVYLEFLLDYNKKINLVSRETNHQDLLRIAADCLIPFEFIPPPSGRLFDIGPGSGFPSLIIFAAFPEMKGTLIERTGKKTGYLSKAAEFLKINAEIINGNFAEVASKLDKASFDYGFMKLVRPDKQIFSQITSLLKTTGKFIAYKFEGIFNNLITLAWINSLQKQ